MRKKCSKGNFREIVLNKRNRIVETQICFRKTPSEGNLVKPQLKTLKPCHGRQPFGESACAQHQLFSKNFEKEVPINKYLESPSDLEKWLVIRQNHGAMQKQR